MDVGPRARGDATEDRGAEGRALVNRDSLKRQLEHRGDDPQPQLAARAAAGDATQLRSAAKLADEVERVAQAERDPLEHRADQRAAVVAEPEPHKRRPSVGIGVRGALAREVGEEQEPFGPGRPRGGLGDRAGRRRRPGRRHPAATAANRRLTASRPSRARRPDRVAESVYAGAGIRRELLERGEHDAGGAEHDRRPGRAIDAHPERAGGLIAAAGGDGDPVRRSHPRWSAPRARAGASAGSSESAASNSSLQRRPATSSSKVPEASERSVACSPHSRSRT